MKIAFRNTEYRLFAGICSFALLISSQPVAADSGVKFYGELDAFVGDSQPAGDGDSTMGIQSNGMTTSYLGISSKHELSNGMTASAGVEMFFQPDSGNQGRFDNDIFFARSAYIGLAGDFGQVKLGRTASLYFLSTILFNPFGDSFAFSPMVLMSYGGGGIYGDSGWSDSIVYSTPQLGGFTTSVAYAFGEQQGDTSTNKMGANTFYKAGDFGFTAAVQKISGPQTGATSLGLDDSQTDAILGASYAMGKNTFYVQYQMMRDDLAAGDIDRDTLVISASIAAGTGSIYLAYGYTDMSADVGGDSSRDIYTLAYNYPLADQIDLYAAFTSDNPEGAEQNGRTLGLGGRFRF